MPVWKTYIGNWGYRTLIAEECHVLFEKQQGEISATGGPADEGDGCRDANTTERATVADDGAPKPPEWPEANDEHLACVPLTDAALVFFAGQSCLMGTPKGIEEQLEELEVNDPNNDRRVSDVVLLSWEERHACGLAGFCRWYSEKWVEQRENKIPLRIWTSNWIQEYLRENIFTKDEDHRILFPKKATERTPEWKTFRARHREILAPQLAFSLYYEAAASKAPRLHAEFRILDKRLVVRIGESSWDKRAMPTLADYHRTCLDRILRHFPRADVILAPDIAERLSLLSELERQVDEQVTSEVHVFSLPPACTIGELCEFAPRQITQPKLRRPPLIDNQTEFSVAKADHQVSVPPAGKHSERKAKIYLALACGGLSDASMIVSPQRRLSIEGFRTDENGARVSVRVNISLLGLKLLDFLLGLQSEETRVFERKCFLLVSPWTEQHVRWEIARLREECPELWEKVEVEYLLQNVVAISSQDHSGSATPFRWRRNRFLYAPAGHFDMIEQILSHTGSEEPDSFVYVSNHNNLGRDLNDSVSFMAARCLEEDWRNVAAAFELTDHFVPRSNPPEPRGPGSYWVQSGESSMLLKPSYVSNTRSGSWEEERNKLVSAPRSGVLMATGSVLIHIGRLRSLRSTVERTPFLASKCDLPEHEPHGEEKSSNGPRAQSLAWRAKRDMDQLSIAAPAACKGVKIEEPPGKPRYFPLKQERDLYLEKRKRLSNLYNDVSGEYRNHLSADVDQMSQQPLLTTIETPRAHAPWGAFGIRDFKSEDPWPEFGIRDFKSENRWPEPESESYEAGIHPNWVPSVARDRLHGVPLDAIVDEEQAAVMAKVLDCNAWLSIQVHPNKWLLDRLQELQTGKEVQIQELVSARKKELEYIDKSGKSEAFYVVRAKQNSRKEKANYFLGFDYERIAESMKRVLKEVEQEPNADQFHRAILDGLCEFESEGALDEEQIDELETKIDEITKTRGMPLRDVLRSALADGEWLLGGDWESVAEGDVGKELQLEFRKFFTQLIVDDLRLILHCRTGHFSHRVLCGVVVILGIEALRRSIAGILSTVDETGKCEKLIQKVFRNDGDSSLLRFFYRLNALKEGEVVNVPPGVVHAAGPGLLLVEFSNSSDNTFRIFDHGREFGINSRPTHYLLAAMSLSEKSFVDGDNEEDFRRDARHLRQERTFTDVSLEVAEPANVTAPDHNRKTSGDGADDDRSRPDDTASETDDGKTPEKDQITAHEEGSIVVCVQGDVTVETTEESTGAGKAMPLAQGHTAFVRGCKPPLKFQLRRHKDYAKCLCLHASARPKRRDRELCVAIGGAHFDFIYDAPNTFERAPERHLWHKVLDTPWRERNWEQRKAAFCEHLENFLAAEDRQEEPIHVLGLSWPGFFKKNDRGDIRLYSNVLECADVDPHALFEGLGYEFTFDDEFAVFDTNVDTQAEIDDLQGGFHGQENDAGLLLNFASGICLGRFDHATNQKFEDPRLQNLGRILWFDPREFKWEFDPEFETTTEKWTQDTTIESTRDGDYRHRPPGGNPRLIRMSDYLSTTAVVLRLLHSVYIKNKAKWREVRRRCDEDLEHCAGKALDDCMKDSEVGTDRQRRAEQWSGLLIKYRAVLNAATKPAFAWLYERAADGKHTGAFFDDFIRSIAYDLAAAMDRLFEENESIRNSTKRVVLSGYGGASFGKAPKGMGNGEESDDLFLKYLREALRGFCWTADLGQPGSDAVRRTKLVGSDYRLLNAFRSIRAMERQP